jgi:hypothetical protein
LQLVIASVPLAATSPRAPTMPPTPAAQSACTLGKVLPQHGKFFAGREGSSIPIYSMYGIFTYIWVIFRANVGKYAIHGAYGIWD